MHFACFSSCLFCEGGGVCWFVPSVFVSFIFVVCFVLPVCLLSFAVLYRMSMYVYGHAICNGSSGLLQ